MKMEDKQIIIIGLIILVGSLFFLTMGIYDLGATNMCSDMNGTLYSQDGEFKCLNMEEINLCDDLKQEVSNNKIGAYGDVNNGIFQ